MASPVVCFKEKEKVGTIIDALHNTEHHGFPVVDMNETGENDIDEQHFGLLKVLIIQLVSNWFLTYLKVFNLFLIGPYTQTSVVDFA